MGWIAVIGMVMLVTAYLMEHMPICTQTTIIIPNQRLRNFTTGIIHTHRLHLAEDASALLGIEIQESDLDNFIPGIKLFLHTRITQQRFWNCKRDLSHGGFTQFDVMSAEEKQQWFGDILK